MCFVVQLGVTAPQLVKKILLCPTTATTSALFTQVGPITQNTQDVVAFFVANVSAERALPWAWKRTR